MTLRRYASVNEASRLHGERIRKTRRGLGMTQQQLAEFFGVHRTTIYRLELGYYNILTAWPKYQILNERMRIWAEMNKGGRKKKYVNGRTRLLRVLVPENLLPRDDSPSRYGYNKRRYINGRENTERSAERSGDQGDHPSADQQADGR